MIHDLLAANIVLLCIITVAIAYIKQIKINLPCHPDNVQDTCLDKWLG